MSKIQSIRGMHDLLPADSGAWQQVEAMLAQTLSRYGYHEIRTPVVEQTELFKRSIGEVTDIVEKEMYTFDDRNGDQLTLRPEGTASCARAGIQHGLFHNQQQKLWYQGPMFRHERPQKGRYRQFHQLGVEAYGIPGADVEAELLVLCQRLWQAFKIDSYVRLELNSLGTPECRAAYRTALVDYFGAHKDALDDDSKRRLQLNPLRILDSKNPEMQKLAADAPVLHDYLCEEAKEHFAQLLAYLDKLNITYTFNQRLVRGLDYYCHTVFEWVTTELGAQGTICAGGRYDGLIKQLGGKEIAGVGFAMGMERFIELVRQYSPEILVQSPVDAYMITIGAEAELEGLQLADRMRSAESTLSVISNMGGGSFKSQLKRADKSNARYAIILAENELEQGLIGLKDLRTAGHEQQLVAYEQLIEILKNSN